MKVANNKILDLVQTGWKQRTKGQYKEAYETYYKALEHDAEHWMVRSALAEVLFIDREYLAAAENYYIAAVNNSLRLELDLLSDNISDQDYIVLRNHRIEKAERLLNKYAMRTGIALYARQYDDPTAKTIRQSFINNYRNEYDPYGYSNYSDISPIQMQRLSEVAIGFGYDFLDTMIQKYDDSNEVECSFAFIFNFFNPKY